MECPIKKVNDIINLKMKEVNERLNMYFHISDPFFGFYNPDIDTNDGIVIDVRTDLNDMKMIISKFPPEDQDDKLKEEKKAFKKIEMVSNKTTGLTEEINALL
jgi:hypothetical protein